MDAQYQKPEAWFPDIPAAEIRKQPIRIFEAGEYLTRRGHAFRCVMLILDGVCDVVNRLDNGGDTITLKLKEGDVVGASECALQNPRYLASVRACGRLRALELTGADFYRWFDSSACFRRYVLQNTVIRLHYTADIAANCRAGSSKLNLATYLLDRYTFFHSVAHGTVVIRENHEMIAGFLGVSVRTVDRQLQSLRNEGLLHMVRGKAAISEQEAQALMKFIDLFTT